jgi:hypothetical protein
VRVFADGFETPQLADAGTLSAPIVDATIHAADSVSAAPRPIAAATGRATA